MPKDDFSNNRQVSPTTLFEILVKENADSLMAFLRASVADRSAADDLFQETMLIAWRKIGEFDRTRPFGAWLRGIAKMLILAHYRAVADRLVIVGEPLLDLLDIRMAAVDNRTGDTFDEKILALRECIARLSELYQQPLDLHYQQQKTTEWIAKHLATTKDAVQKRLQRARQQLADCLQRKGLLPATGANP